MNFFEFDAVKSESNRTKHGIDFVEAQAVITYRGANVRLISVRRARTEEVALYGG